MSEISDLLDKHLKNGAAQKPEGQWKCRVCGRDDFQNVQQLATHVRLTHPKAPKAKYQRPSQKAPPPDKRPPGFLTADAMVQTYPGILKQFAKKGTLKMMRKHPEYQELLLGRGEPKQNLYDAINRMRHGKRSWREKIAKMSLEEAQELAKTNHKPLPGRPGRPLGGHNRPRKHWSQEQYDLARTILQNPQYRRGAAGKLCDWERALSEHPEWAKALDFDRARRNQFMSFVGRVRDGSAPYRTVEKPATPVVVPEKLFANSEPVQAEVTVQAEAIEIDGQKWTQDELRKLIALARDGVSTLKFCPHCGHNLQMHTQAFRIARKHSNQD